MAQQPPHTLSSLVRQVVLLIVTVAMLAAFAGEISNSQPTGPRSLDEPIAAPGAGLDL